MNSISIYESKNGVVEVRLENDTVWLSQEQMGQLFDVQKAAVSKHLSNIFTSGELERTATVSKKETVRQEGTRTITRQIEYFNLDAVLSVGYRVNSARASHFRQWATRVLREHLTQGYSLNRQRFETNARELENALRLIEKASHSELLPTDTSRGLIDIVTRYARTFLLLQRYDEGLLTEPPQQQGGVLDSLDVTRIALESLKADLTERGEATPLFACERGDVLAALLGNLEQTVFGKPAYPTVESKAAHLLYFIIKDHPFVDGNKRSAAFLFVSFLRNNGRLLDSKNQPVINDIGLAALTLLVAKSDPTHKETIIKLIMNMLS